MQLITLLFALLVCLTAIPVQVSASDWKFLATVPLENGQGSFQCYDIESLKYSQGIIRVWTKSVKSSELDRLSKNKEIIEGCANKIANSYYPPFVKVFPPEKYNDYIDIVAWEEVCNYSGTKTYGNVLFEIDCKATKMRSLTSHCLQG